MAADQMVATITNEEYGDRNAELFHERRAIQTQLAALLATEEHTAETDRSVTKLRRQLDDVTTEIVTFNLGLVRSYCRRFTSASSKDDSADFEAAGLLGLMRAIDSFDPSQGRFGHWAFKPIQREVLRGVRDADHPNVNLGDFERRPEILRAYRHLQGDDDSSTPTHADVARVVGTTVNQVRRVLAPPQFESVDRPLGTDASLTVSETVASDAPGPESVVMSIMTLSALRRYGLAVLDERERYVLVRRFGLDGEPAERLSDIGRTLGVSRETIRQVEAKAIAKMQHPMVLRRIHRHDAA